MKSRQGLSLLLMSAFVSGSLWAVPAKRITKSVRQSDGTTIEVTLTGDEVCHYYVTADGIPVREGKDGFYYYLTGTDSLTLSSVEAHAEAKRSTAEKKFVKDNTEQVRKAIQRVSLQQRTLRNERRVKRLPMEVGGTDATEGNAEAGSNPLRVAAKRASYMGVRKGLVILVNYTDRKMMQTRENFNAMLNSESYTKNGCYGSVSQYFKDQSYGQFELDFDVVGPYTLSNNMKYYGENDKNGYDLRPGELIKEACTLADGDVNFADYDWDGDGYVDQVYVIYAGYSEASGASAYTVWPHEWALSSATGSALQLDGVTIDTYACSNELHGTSGSVMDGIGTLCHEFSHCLGFPDMYDTSGSNYAMYTWDLLDYGSYNGDTYAPAGYTSYERWAAGWLTPEELNDKAVHVQGMKALTDAPEAYVLYNNANKNEYYLLENRQKSSWDKSLSGHGLLVTHVDYDKNAWYNNQVNVNASHMRMAVVAADNKYAYSNANGDTYPGTTSNTSLTDTSIPSTTLFSANSNGKKFLGKPIYNISEEDGLISFYFLEAKDLSAPQLLPATDVTANSFVANWDERDKAVSYTVELATQTENYDPKLLLYEDFSNFKKTDNSGLEVTDFDAYMQQAGWTGYKVYPADNMVQVGSRLYTGWIQTPVCTKKENESFELEIGLQLYNTTIASSVSCDLEVYDTSGNKLLSYTYSTSSVAERFSITMLMAGITDCSFRLVPNGRIYVNSFTVRRGGDSTEDESSDYVIGTYTTADTHYPFTDLTDSAYYYRVRATIEDGDHTEWSDYQLVTMGTAGSGDVDADGTVTEKDARAAAAYILDPTGTFPTEADMDGDGKITVTDILRIYNKIKNNK